MNSQASKPWVLALSLAADCWTDQIIIILATSRKLKK